MTKRCRMTAAQQARVDRAMLGASDAVTARLFRLRAETVHAIGECSDDGSAVERRAELVRSLEWDASAYLRFTIFLRQDHGCSLISPNAPIGMQQAETNARALIRVSRYS
jgi:hypothetical protein